MIERQQGTHVDSEASQFVSALGTHLAHATPQPTVLQCRFVLYDDTVGLQVPGFGLLKRTHQVNALPGGIVLVPLSLFDITADEAEFSSALARGIAHVALRHWMRTIVRSSFSSPWEPPFPKTLLFTRSFESEADRAAVEILARTGLNPESDSRN